MEKVGKQELCPCQHRDKYHELGSALEGCVKFAYDGYSHNPRCTYTDVETDPLYMKIIKS
ncbi:hypothetical protein H5410_064492 [Solanum commersonii]|uniref:Uncharacterized protein n=1 Tax=Solanum commersonii TaxID=4109 RepID=A0A9J5VZC1_SOLCO|nr:hypothetical protein H5410_064492 [Solanum commersonii]